MLEINNLKKRYDSDIVLNGIDFELDSGEIVAIMGPSGCGKSTFIRSINRLIEPDSGEIYFMGKALHKMKEVELQKIRQKIAFVFQHFNLLSRLNVRQNVALALIKRGCTVEEAYRRAETALASVGLEELGDSNINQLSGGEKQRVGIARALVQEPDLILLDEPTASLDPILVKDVLDVLEDLAAREKGVSMIIVTHEVAFARRAADRVCLMDEGKFIETGPPGKVFNKPVSWIGKKYKDLINYY